jgi:hypothetical protein
VTVDEYCRAIEAHLTRRNDGHLIRIVGPAFELVRGWAEQGIPFKVACHGIDRTVDRAQAKGPRRRPLRVEFCTADVLDAFDEWRRAVGLRGMDEAAATRRREGLATHITRAIGRLTALRSPVPPAGGAGHVRVPEERLDEIVRALDGLASRADTARGEARAEILRELAALDRRLLDAAREAAAPLLPDVERQAEDDLRPFRERMPADAWAQARGAAVDRLLREQAQLPTLATE